MNSFMVRVVDGARSFRDKVAGVGLALAMAFGVGVASLPAPAYAALTLDSTAILADVATCVAFITAVGLGVLGLIFVAKAIRWARRAG
jgi:uncharacterized membrane protein